MSVHTIPSRDGNVPRGAHPDILMLVRYWQYIHPDDGLPGCGHFNLDEISALKPNMRLLDVLPGGDYRYRVRMIGETHLRQLGYDPTGRWYDEITERFQNSVIELDLARVCHYAEPVYRKGRTLVPYVSGNQIIERVHVPLARDGETVDCIASLTLFYPELRDAKERRSSSDSFSGENDNDWTACGGYDTAAYARQQTVAGQESGRVAVT